MVRKWVWVVGHYANGTWAVHSVWPTKRTAEKAAEANAGIDNEDRWFVVRIPWRRGVDTTTRKLAHFYHAAEPPAWVDIP